MGSTESTLLVPELRADCDFPGQVTRDTDCGLRQGFLEGPGEGSGLVGACARPGHLPGPSGAISPGGSAKEGLLAPLPPRGCGGTHRVAWLRPEALEVRGAETPAEDPGKRPGTVAYARRSGQPALSRGAELSRRHSPRAFGGVGLAEPWHSRPLAFGSRWSLPPLSHFPVLLVSAVQTLGTRSGCFFFPNKFLQRAVQGKPL